MDWLYPYLFWREVSWTQRADRRTARAPPGGVGRRAPIGLFTTAAPVED